MHERWGQACGQSAGIRALYTLCAHLCPSAPRVPVLVVKLLYLTSLLSYNPHTIQFSHLKCTIQCLFCIVTVVQPSPQHV